jgi:hypothetical protein
MPTLDTGHGYHVCEICGIVFHYDVSDEQDTVAHMMTDHLSTHGYIFTPLGDFVGKIH